MALPWVLIQYGTNGATGPTNGTIAGPPPWVLIGYGTDGTAPAPSDTTRGVATVLTDRGHGAVLTRKKYEEILLAERAIEAAEARAQKLKAKPKRALVRAAEAVEETVSAMGLLEALSPQLELITEALRAATQAKAAEVVALANLAREMAEQELLAMEDEEEAILMLLQ